LVNTPIVLAGFSFGGAIAAEVAQALQCLGNNVKIIILFDSYAKFPNQFGIQQLQNSWLKLLSMKERKYYTLQSLCLLFKELFFLGLWIFKHKLKWTLTNSRYTRVFHRSLWSLFDLGDFDKISALRDEGGMFVPDRLLARLYEHALKSRNQYSVDLQAVLFRAAGGNPKLVRALGSSLGWENVFAQRLEIISLPGDHLTMIRAEPYKLILSQAFNKVLSSAE
jgi:thioesterase domain-containing protein